MFKVLALLHLFTFQLSISFPLQEQFGKKGLLINLTNFLNQDVLDSDLSAVPNLQIESEDLLKPNTLRDDTLSLIVNGNVAVRGQFPYQVALIYMINQVSGYLTCGGSLISSQYVLTAAHCVDRATTSTRWLAAIGGIDLTKSYEEGRIVLQFTISNIKIHENYNNVTYKNDVALIRLPSMVVTSAYIKRVELPTRQEAKYLNTFAGNSVVVSGFGRTKDSSQLTSPYLLYGYMSVMDQAVCMQTFLAVYGITDGQICAAVGSSKASICNGDSGGPLVIPSFNSRKIQVGIVSLGAGNCEQGYPAIYTRVGYYLNWIESNSDVKIN